MFMCVSLLVSSFICLTFPVGFGRAIMSLWMGETSVHELYTAACGLYFIWLCCRAVTMVMSWIPLGWTGMAKKFEEWFLLGVKCTSAAFFLVGVIPMLLGLLFELVVVVPLRVPPDQTALFFPAQDWALGILHMKIICAITMMGPNWWLKQALEQVYQDGIRNIKLYFIIRHLALPVMSALLFAITLPYVLSRGIVPMFDNPNLASFCFHRIYPSTVALVVLVFAFIFQGRQFQLLYEHIKNDKYLVGKRLVNYSHLQRVNANLQKEVAALQ